MIVSLVLGGVVLGLALLVRHLRRNHGTLEALGIPVHKPLLCFGSPPFLWNKVAVHDFYLDLAKRYGYTWGSYQGTTPVINTIDPAVVKCVLIEKFGDFVDTFDTEGMADSHLTIDIVGGEKWQMLRKGLSPTFTTGRLKGMIDPLKDVAAVTLKKLKAFSTGDGGDTINLVDVFHEMTLDGVSRCAFGTTVDRSQPIGSKDEPYIIRFGREAATVFQLPDSFSSLAFQLVCHLPWFERVFPMLPEAFDKILDYTGSIYKQREKLAVQPADDFVARLIKLKKDLEGTHLACDPSVFRQMHTNILMFLPS